VIPEPRPTTTTTPGRSTSPGSASNTTTNVTTDRYASLHLTIEREEQWPLDRLEVPDLLDRWGLSTQSQECVWVIAFDPGMRVRTVVEISRGDFLHANIHLPSLLGAVITAGAERFMLAHNHPSNDPRPTEGDVEATRWVSEAAELCGLTLEDHWITTPTAGAVSLVGLSIMQPSLYVAVPAVQGA